MKYMGHKGRILESIRNQIARFAKDATTICDPFCGSGVVAWDLAEQFDRRVVAGDLQSFAAARAAAVVLRTERIGDTTFVDLWFDRATKKIEAAIEGARVPRAPNGEDRNRVAVARNGVLSARSYVAGTLSRRFASRGESWPMTRAYAGYYFSIQQAMRLDALRSTLPEDRSERTVALASLIAGASKCAASPGHTAQPLGTTRSSLPHIVDAWNRSVCAVVRREVESIVPRCAKKLGEAIVGDWETTIGRLEPGDVVFCDPPYSDVHYSRFYHVLETLSRGVPISVSGTGRNPPFEERPESDFSRKSKSKEEASNLVRIASKRDLRMVITFPVTPQSNGLSAAGFAREARRVFGNVELEEVKSVFSSLGGNGHNGTRPAREKRTERIICCYN